MVGQLSDNILFEDFSFKGYDQQPPGLSKPGFFLSIRFPSTGPQPPLTAASPLFTEIHKEIYKIVWFML